MKHGPVPFNNRKTQLLLPPPPTTATAGRTSRNRRRNSPCDQLSAATLRTASRKHNVLLPVYHIAHRQPALRTSRHCRLPDFLARLLVVRMEHCHATGAFTRKQEVLRHKQPGL